VRIGQFNISSLAVFLGISFWVFVGIHLKKSLPDYPAVYVGQKDLYFKLKKMREEKLPVGQKRME